MAEGKIKGITVEIGGNTDPLAKALKEMNKPLNSMQRELKGIESLLKMDPSNVDLLRQKEELLGKSISETENKLKALKAAKEQADRDMANGTQVNEEEYRNLVREISATENRLNKLNDEMKKFGSVSAQQIAAVGGKMQEVGGKITDVGKKVSVVSGAAAGAIGGLVGMAVQAGKTADDINTLSTVTGIATDEIQKIKYASELVDVSFETISGSMVKLKNNMESARDGSSNLQGYFDRLGISVTNADGSLRDSNEVFYEAIDALGQVSNETERDTLAMDIFGKSAQELNPLIMGGADALREYGKAFEESGMIMSEEDLNKINDFNNELDETKASMQATAQVLGAEVGEALMPLFQSLAETLRNVLEWVRGLDSGTVRMIMTILAVVAALGPLIIFIGQLVSSIGAILAFAPTLVTALGAVKVAFAAIGGPVTIIIALITALVLKFIHAYNTSEEFRNKVNAAFNSVKETVSAVLTAVVAKVKEFITVGKNIAEGLWKGISGAKTWLLAKIKEWCGSILKGIKAFFGIHSPSKVMKEEVGEQIPAGMAEGIEEGTPEVTEAVDGMAETVMDEMDKALDAMQERIDARAEAISGFAGIFDAVAEQTEVEGQSLIDNLSGQVELLKQWQTDMENLMSRGISESMLAELREQGPAAAAEIHSLTQMTDDELAIFGELYAEKIKLATETAVNELGGLQLAITPVVDEMAAGAAYAVENKSTLSEQTEKDYTKAYETVANMFATALLEGLNFVGNSIFDAIPKILEFYIDSTKMAKTTWDAFDTEGNRRNRYFAPTHSEIYRIALSAAKTVVPKEDG